MSHLTAFRLALAPFVLLPLSGCIEEDLAPERLAAQDPAIAVDLGAIRATVSPVAFGMHSSVYDNALRDPRLPEQLAESGIALLRYPGGGYSDNYHWSTYSMTPWSDGNAGYLAAGNDFGGFAAVLDATGTEAMITVNYGSNLAGDGPGEPREAAAWVAYANGDVDDETVIGEDGTGVDWLTVAHWARLRASAPLVTDDGYNFLRIERPAPLGIRYFEIGNEVFGNGYYGSNYELDLHLPYTGDEEDRVGHKDLSPTTYGRGVVDYAEAMRAVDPSIAIGAVLNTPPKDYEWGPDWNERVLAECVDVIDFVVVHFYRGSDDHSVMRASHADIDEIMRELDDTLAEAAGEDAGDIEVAITELGPNTGDVSPVAVGIFAAEAHATFLEAGAHNLDWLELHKPSFIDERTGRTGPAYDGIRLARLLAGPGDRYVQAASGTPGVYAHAALRDDGTLGLMVVNVNDEDVTALPVTITGGAIGPEGTRRTYGVAEGGDEGQATLGEVSPIDGMGDEFEVDVRSRSINLYELMLE